MLSPQFQAFIWEKLRFRSATEMSPGQSISCVLMVNLIYVILEHDIGCLANTMSVTCQLMLTLRVPLQCVLLTIPSLLLHCCLLLPTSTCSPSLPPSSPCFFPPPKLPLYKFLRVQSWERCIQLLSDPTSAPSTFDQLSSTSCPLCPSVSFAVSDVIRLPTLLLCRTQPSQFCTGCLLLAACSWLPPASLIPLCFPLCWPVLTKAPVWSYTY